MKTKWCIQWISLLTVAVLGSGCVAALVGGAALGAGTVVYLRGELRSPEAVSMQKAWTASHAALKELGYAVTDEQQDALKAKITARGAGDKRVEIRLTNKGQNVTEIAIRVGTFGDEDLSRRILEKIRGHL